MLSLASIIPAQADEAFTPVLSHRGITSIANALGDGVTIDNGAAIVVSPDGTRLYAAAPADHALLVFGRDPATGAITALGGHLDSSSPADDEAGLSGIADVAVHPSDRYIYTAALNEQALSVFERTDGGLVHRQTLRAGAPNIEGLVSPYRITVSPDGDHVYVATRNSAAADAVLVFRVAGENGMLAFAEIHQGVIDNAAAMRFDADGAHLYLADADGLLVMARDTDAGSASYGALAPMESHRNGENGITGLDGASAIAVAPDGNHVYLAATLDDAVTVFGRDAGTGALSFTGSYHSGENGLGTIAAPLALAASPDGGHLYLADTLSEQLLVLRRDRETGELSAQERHGDEPAAMALHRIFTIAVSPDGGSIYTASLLEPQIDGFSVAAADLAVTVNASSPAERDAIAIDVVVDNHGPAAAQRVRLSAPLPDGASAIVDVETPADFDCTRSGVRVVCTAERLEAGESRQLRLRLAAATGTTQVSGSIAVSAAERDTDMSNNSDAASVAIIAETPTSPSRGGGGAADHAFLLLAILLLIVKLLDRREYGTVRR
jgi:DNA-binding beta-propeller fold protein YncE